MNKNLLNLFLAVVFFCVFCVKVVYALSDVGRDNVMSYVNAGVALLTSVCWFVAYFILRHREKHSAPLN